MANHTSPVPAWLNEEYMTKAFRQHFKSPTLNVKSLKITPGSKEGDNYVCQILRIHTDIEVNGSIEKKSVIGKLTIESKTLDSFKDQIDVFQVEADFFSLLLPKLLKVNENVDAAKKFAPDCYLVDFEKKLVLMEDMMEQGFFLQGRQSFLSKEQALAVLTRHASFHGASHLVLQEDPSIKEKFRLSLFASQPNAMMEQWTQNYSTAMERHSASYGLSAERTKKLHDLGRRLKEENMQICRFDESKLNSLLHGDCWKSNMLFHTTEGKLDDVVLLDFQGVTYNNFAIDLNYFLFSSVSAEVLATSLDELIEHYYETLKAIAPEIPGLSLERIKKEFNDKLFLGMLMFCSFRPIIMAEVPLNIDEMVSGVVQTDGYTKKEFISDLHTVFHLFDGLKVL